MLVSKHHIELLHLLSAELFYYKCKRDIHSFGKLSARAPSVNKSTGFCRISVTPSLPHLGALLRDDLRIIAFF